MAPVEEAVQVAREVQAEQVAPEALVEQVAREVLVQQAAPVAQLMEREAPVVPRPVVAGRTRPSGSVRLQSRASPSCTP